MQSSRCLRRAVKSSTRFHAPSETPRRYLHASQRLLADKPSKASPSSKSPSSSRITQTSKPDPSKPHTDHLIPENELTVRRGKQIGRLERSDKSRFKPYTPEQLEKLKEKYSPQQIAAIKAGEESIHPDDILNQGILHKGHMTLDYLDDFSVRRPAIDKHAEKPGLADPVTGKLPKVRWKTEEDLADDLEDWLDAQPNSGAEDGDLNSFYSFLKDHKPYESKADLTQAKSFVAPELPKIDDPIVRSQARGAQVEGDIKIPQGFTADEFERLARQTGYPVRELAMFQSKTLVVRFVSHQTRLGNQRSAYYMTIAGNGNGIIGIGEAKGANTQDAATRAYANALRNLIPITRYEDRTIYGSVKGKAGATELELHARHPGFGRRCSELIWEICKSAGIHDISARVTRARNPMNIVKATMIALTSQRNPENIAIGRGRRMVDLRKVYYSGLNS